MSTYTLSILDLLQENAGGRTLTPTRADFVSNVREIAKESIFGASLNALDPKYQDVFAAGFCFQYMNDEIGNESLAGWQMALAGRLHNNAAFINQIYSTMDKQIFSNYSTRRSTRDGSEVRTETDSERATRLENETGTNTVAETGTESTTRDGTDSTLHGRVDTRGGATTDTYNNLKVQNSGTSSDDGDSTLTFNGRGTTTVHEKMAQLSNTPQQGLQGLRDGNYLTSAQLDNDTDTATQTGSENTATSSTHTDNTASTTSGSVSHADTTTSTASGTDTTTTASTDAHTRDLATDAATTTDRTGNDTRDRESNGNTDSTEVTVDESFELSYEMLTAAQPLMSRIWPLFDTLFLQIL